MTKVDEQQDARLDRIDGRLRKVEETIVELNALAKLARPIIVLLAASLGVDIAPMLV